MCLSQIADQIEQLLQKKFFDLMFTLERDKMTALGPNDSLNFTFRVTVSNSIQKSDERPQNLDPPKTFLT